MRTCETGDIRPFSSSNDDDCSGAHDESSRAPGRWWSDIDELVMPVVQESVEAELEASNAEPTGEVYEAESEEDTAPQRVAKDPGEPTREVVEDLRNFLESAKDKNVPWSDCRLVEVVSYPKRGDERPFLLWEAGRTREPKGAARAGADQGWVALLKAFERLLAK